MPAKCVYKLFLSILGTGKQELWQIMNYQNIHQNEEGQCILIAFWLLSQLTSVRYSYACAAQ